MKPTKARGFIRSRKPRGPNLKTRVLALSIVVDRLERLMQSPSVDERMYAVHDDRIRTLEDRVRNLTDYINRNRV